VRKIIAFLKKNIRRILPGVLISVVALGVAFYLSGFFKQDAQLDFSVIRPVHILGVIGLTLLSLLTKTMEWRVLLDNKASIGKTFLAVNEGYFLNNIFPLKAGEVGRAVFMGKTTGQGTFHVLSTIVIERAFDVAIAAGLLLATLPRVLGSGANAKSTATLSLAAVVGVFVVLYLMARFNDKVRQWVARLGRRVKLVNKFIEPNLEQLLNGLTVLTRPGQFLLAVFWSLITWFLWVNIFYVMLLSIAPGAPFWWGAFIDSFLALGAAVPSAPAGLGVYEAALVGAMGFLGISGTLALPYALVQHILQFLVTGVIGFYGIIREGRSISGLFDEIQKRNQADISVGN
jgi:uncharacterized protein (TIRG00374 family)